ncbi:helix-turn-helix domain-containing protein [Cereibacter sphaeroides]|nr:helix-turn-helix transcriptional regulator [Cereibacter sphaeroides]
MTLRIRKLRQERGWTIDHVASLTGYSRGFISQVENDKRNPSAEFLAIFAEVFGVPVPELYDAGEMADDLLAMMDIMKALSPEDRKAALRAVSGFLDRKSQ